MEFQTMNMMMVHRLIFFVLFLVNESFMLNISHSCDVDPSSNTCMLNELKSLKTDVRTLKQELQTLKTKGRACPAIAFRAQITSTIHNPTKGYHIVYDDVKLNIGNAYNSHHGTFVAPTSGTYFLSYHVSISPGNTRSLIRIVMKRNGEILSHTMGYGSQWILDTYTDIVHLKAGDDVWIEVLESNFPFDIAGNSPFGPHSVFEGFMINC